MSKNENNQEQEQAKAVKRTLEIDWAKVEGVNDLKLILSCVGMSVEIEGDIVPANLVPLHNLGMLIERK